MYGGEGGGGGGGVNRVDTTTVPYENVFNSYLGLFLNFCASSRIYFSLKFVRLTRRTRKEKKNGKTVEKSVVISVLLVCRFKRINFSRKSELVTVAWLRFEWALFLFNETTCAIESILFTFFPCRNQRGFQIWRFSRKKKTIAPPQDESTQWNWFYLWFWPQFVACVRQRRQTMVSLVRIFFRVDLSAPAIKIN